MAKLASGFEKVGDIISWILSYPARLCSLKLNSQPVSQSASRAVLFSVGWGISGYSYWVS